jgi:hypothetical protein
MAGWNTIQRIRHLEKQADGLGMMFTKYKHDEMYGESVALIPKDTDALPIYSRDAALFVGSLENAEQWMRGVEWAREYDRLTIDRNNDKKRERKEQDERNRQLMRTIKNSQLSTGVVNPQDC